MNDSPTSRSRTITWEDPAVAVQAGKTLSGMRYLEALQSGELPPPPLAVLLGMWITEAGEGRIVFAMEPAEYHYNPLGTVHGGVLATLLDSAMGCAVQSMLPVGTGYTTLELKANYLRPVTDRTGTVYCEGKVIHLGGRIATAEGRLTDASGKLYAHGTTTCIVLRP
ncbi:MAG: PaaI family thioesterase [Chloroflexota bacterium]|nr:PaaI family thioesterase [Chloroflexota bacterium]